MVLGKLNKRVRLVVTFKITRTIFVIYQKWWTENVAFTKYMIRTKLANQQYFKNHFFHFLFFKISRGLKMIFFKVWGPNMKISQTSPRGLKMIFVTSQGPKMIFHSKLSHQGPKLSKFETPGTKSVNFQNFPIFHQRTKYNIL